MKALSIRQPWAWAILHAGKRIENRRWSTSYRGPVLLHAAKAWGTAEKNDARYIREVFRVDVPLDMPLGGIVGRARIVDVVLRSDDPWYSGPYGWVLEDVEALPFRPWRGELGLFEVPA